MARSMFRAVAGAGTAAAFLLVGSAAIPMVSADPGYSHGSQAGGDSRGGDGDGGDSHGISQSRNDDGGWHGGVSAVGSGGMAGPNRTIASGGITSVNGTESNPNRSATTTRAGTTASPSSVVTNQSVTVRSVDGVTTPSTSTPVPAVPSVPADRVSDGDGVNPVAVAPPVTPPAVTVGNGRSPGTLTRPPEDVQVPTGVAADVAAPAVTPPVVTPQLPQLYQLDEAPAEPMVASLWAAAVPGWPSGLIFGLAGLILAPIAGAWLGYRQARASRAAAQLIRD